MTRQIGGSFLCELLNPKVVGVVVEALHLWFDDSRGQKA
jgi:hypothetical protein